MSLMSSLKPKAGRKVRQHELEALALREQIDDARGRIRSLGDLAHIAGVDATARLNQLLDQNLGSMEDAEQLTYRGEHSPWEIPRWTTWRPAQIDPPGEIRIGSFREQRSGSMLPIPCSVPLIGQGRALVMLSNGGGEAEAAQSLLQSLVVRTAVLYPRQCRYTLLDPGGNGLAFPMARNLSRVSLGTGDVRRDLENVTVEIQRIISTYLDAGRTSFEQIPEEMRVSEAYHFVFVADFPNGYDLRAAEALQNVARTGPRAGVYVVAHVNLDHYRQATGDFDRYVIDNRTIVNMADRVAKIDDTDVELIFDEAPSAALQDLVFDRLRATPPRDRPISWDEVNRLPDTEWWQETSEQRISAPIGRYGANQHLSVWFGNREWEGRPCVHGVLGAMPGAGKSTLFHNLITSLAVRYSPDELRFYLIDGKFGVEFQPYRVLPHAEVVSLRTSPELSRSVLRELVAEMSRRNATFARNAVVDLPGYRGKGQPDGSLARILLVVDEYQQLFDDDREGEASANLLRLSQQGRSVGIHMLLASQRFDTAGMLHRNDIFGNIHLRMAMQLAQADVATLTDFGPKGRRLISTTADRAGRLVVNERAGDDDANLAGKTALLDPGRRDQIVGALAKKAVGLPNLPRKVVFNGHAQPDLLDNPHIQDLLQLVNWPSPHTLEAIARRLPEFGGLGVVDWLAAERPVPLFLGQEFNVRGHAKAVLRRRPTENLLVVGERHEERVAMLAAALASAALTSQPDQLQLWVNDRSVARTDWSEVLPATCRRLAEAGIAVRFSRREDEAATAVGDAVAEIERRLALPEGERVDQPTLLLVLNEPDRVTALHRTPDDFGYVESDLGQRLRVALARGPSVGVHVLVGGSSLGVIRTVFADKIIQREFRHRVAMQMPEDDSFLFVRSSRASKLSPSGERPIAALAFDNQRQSTVKFKPYSIDVPEDLGLDERVHGTFLDQVASISHRLAQRAR